MVWPTLLASFQTTRGLMQQVPVPRLLNSVWCRGSSRCSSCCCLRTDRHLCGTGSSSAALVPHDRCHPSHLHFDPNLIYGPASMTPGDMTGLDCFQASRLLSWPQPSRLPDQLQRHTCDGYQRTFDKAHPWASCSLLTEIALAARLWCSCRSAMRAQKCSFSPILEGAH